ncbi:GNAT family N-acetyltransferase [Breoghania sp.]|uniref:GNAT family N-acetyltransferase n=1 Tax=Breoghania sp. TaxID=2065378 RepID=UPI0029CA7F3B|nr:GNAT family N-acetyltransferase [Breoghania sp.]
MAKAGCDLTQREGDARAVRDHGGRAMEEEGTMDRDDMTPAEGAAPLAAPVAISALEPLLMTPMEAVEEAGAWAELAEQAMEPNPFFRPEFLLSYLHHVESEPITIAAVRRRGGGGLAGLMPLGRKPLGLAWKTPHVWTHAYAPLGTPLLCADCAQAAAEKLLRVVMSHVGTFLAMPQQRLDGAVAAAFRDAAAAARLKLDDTAHYERPVLSLEGTMEAFLQRISGQRRRRYAKGYRRLKEQGHLVRDHLSGAQAVEAFDAFLELEQSGWKGESATALASNPYHAAFAREAVQEFAASGKLLVDRLRLDERTIAAVVAFRDGPRVYEWKIAFDEEQASQSPGVQVVLAAMENYFAIDGLLEVDSLSGQAPSLIDGMWKDREIFGTMLIAGGRGAGARMAMAHADIAAYETARRSAKGVLSRLGKRRKG